MNNNTIALNAPMNELLASLEAFYAKLQHYHWYVKGRAFFTVHAKLEEYYDEVREDIDEVAEALLMIGGAPVSTMAQFTALSKIAEDSGAYVSADELLPVVSDDYSTLNALASDVKSRAESEGNALISALMDDLIAQFSKAHWMISQSLMD